MELLIRFIVFVAAILGASVPTQRHFAQLRVSCIAIDIFLPLLVSGQSFEPEYQMEDSTTRRSASSFTPSKAVPGHQPAAPSMDEAKPSQENKEQEEDSVPIFRASVDTLHSNPTEDVASGSNIVVHGGNMTLQERREAEDVLRKKYGAIDENQSVSSDPSLHGINMTMQERKDAQEILRQKYGATPKQ